jgi:hypothetical protein
MWLLAWWFLHFLKGEILAKTLSVPQDLKVFLDLFCVLFTKDGLNYIGCQVFLIMHDVECMAYLKVLH